MSTTPRPISLAHLTVLDTTPPELVTVAAAAGFRTTSCTRGRCCGRPCCV